MLSRTRILSRARAKLVPAGAVAVLIGLASVPVSAQQATIGVYTDATGTDCSLSDLTPGTMEAYVVVRPGANGLTGVQVDATKPACFTGTYLGDVNVPGTLLLGNSQAGVSVVLSSCSMVPTHVLTVLYSVLGTTTTCCEYTVVPDVGQTDVIATDCSFVESPVQVVTGSINADASCECGDSSPPTVPLPVFPADGQPLVTVTPLLQWFATDPDGDPMTFAVYFGTEENPPLLADSLVESSYYTGVLNENASYRWRVVATDVHGLSTGSPEWTFTTKSGNQPPVTPFNPIPFTSAAGITTTGSLQWSSGDPDQDAIVFDIYFGTEADPPLAEANYPYPLWNYENLTTLTTYNWRVVARDPLGVEAEGPLWSFTTHSSSDPPGVPYDPIPADGQLVTYAQPSLSWKAGTNGLTGFDLYLGTDPDPPLLVSNLPSPGYRLGVLQPSQIYYWRVVVNSVFGQESGPVWHFRTVADNDPPNPPTPISPPHLQTNVSTTPTLQWSATDPDGDVLTFDVFLGPTSGSMSLVASNLTEPRRAVGPLLANTEYTWQVVSKDPLGQATSGALWRFTTGASSNPAPVLLSPLNGAQFVSINTILFWSFNVGEIYLVYLGTVNPPPYATTVVGTGVWDPPGQLLNETTYYWRVLGVNSGQSALWSFRTGSAPLPVLFSSFDAKAGMDGVTVSWKLSGDETAASYELWRRTGDDAFRPVARGSASGATGSYRDQEVEPETTYDYQLVVRSTLGNEFQSPIATATTPKVALSLGQNHPYPFNPQTSIPYTLPGGSKPSHVRLFILDVSGGVVRRLVNGSQTGGSHTAIWTGDDDRGTPVSSGVYFYVLDVDGRRLTRKLVLLK